MMQRSHGSPEPPGIGPLVYFTVTVNALAPWLLKFSTDWIMPGLRLPSVVYALLSVAILAVGAGLGRRASWARKAAIVVAALAFPAWGFTGLLLSLFFALVLNNMDGTGAQMGPGMIVSAVIFIPLCMLPNILAIRRLTRPEIAALFSTNCDQNRGTT